MEAEGANNWTSFMGQFKERISESFERNGIAGVYKLVTENLDKWRRVPLNIAVTKNSGVGKSSFINTLKGTYADDEGGANVDVVQCTEAPTPYVHPKNENLLIWDLPGVGTPSFPQQTHLQQVKFDRYDCFIIISSPRFTENDLWLARAINSKNQRATGNARKPFYFVRTKVDHDLSDYKRSHRIPEPQEDTLERIRSEINSELENGGFLGVQVFLIANYEQYKYDFGSLTNLLVLESPTEKKEAMALSLSVLTEEIIETKKKVLSERMWKIC